MKPIVHISLDLTEALSTAALAIRTGVSDNSTVVFKKARLLK